jgi:hypothetical protein
MSYWVLWSPDNTATITQASSKPAAPKGGKVFGPYASLTGNGGANQGLQLAVKGHGKTVGVGGTIQAATNPSIVTSALENATGLTAIGNFFGWFSQRGNIMRLAEGVLGGALILVAVSHLASNTKAGQTIIETGKQAAKAAAIAG